MRKEFGVHMLNAQGKERALKLAEGFSTLANLVEELGENGRERSLALTKLEEACFFAKKAMAIQSTNQEI